MGMKVTREELDKMMKIVDKDHSGEIEYGETNFSDKVRLSLARRLSRLFEWGIGDNSASPPPGTGGVDAEL